MSRSRNSETEMLLWAFLLLLVLPAAMGAAGTMVKAAIPALLTRGFLGGVYLAWYAAYNGTQYYSLQPQAMAGINAIILRLQSGGDAAGRVARHELNAWLRTADPLGLVRKAIEAGEIADAEYLFGVQEE